MLELVKILWDGSNAVNVVIDPNILNKLSEKSQEEVTAKALELIQTIQNGIKG